MLSQSFRTFVINRKQAWFKPYKVKVHFHGIHVWSSFGTGLLSLYVLSEQLALPLHATQLYLLLYIIILYFTTTRITE